MNTVTLEKTYEQTSYTINLTFKDKRELMTEFARLGQDYYIMNVTLESAYGTYNQISFDGTASLSISAPSVNYGDDRVIKVYGAYLRDNVVGELPPFPYFGITSQQDSHVGAGSPPFENYEFQGATYANNKIVFNYIDKGTVSDTFPSGTGVTLWNVIEHLIGRCANYNQYAGVAGHITMDLTIDTNVPFFDTYEHMHAFAMSGETEGLLNGYIAPPLEDESRYYIDNIVSNNGSISDIREENYYHFNGPEKCLGFASDDGIHATLYSYNGGPSEVKVSHDRGYTYEVTSGFPTSYYVRADLTVPAYVITFNTNIPFFVGDENDTGKEKLDSYIKGLPAPSGREYSILDAWNRSDVDGTIKGVIGELVDQTVNGTSSIAYTYGVQMFSLTATQKAQFLKTILSGDVMDALVDNTKMFGQSAISALQSLRYMPIDASEVCSIGSASSCQIGSYTHTFSSSVDQILQNDKMINCGSAFFESPYEAGDFRNLEPWCRLYILLPYAGVHALTISKYINKRVSIKLAVDITSGACEYHLFANNLEMDSFTGSMGTQIPLTAEDNARHVSGIQNGLIQSIAGLTQITLSAGAAVASGGTLTPAAIAAGASGANTMAQGLQKMGDSFNNAPVDTKGASVGNLGDFGVTSPYFIFCWANSITPKNELSIVGKPSNTGGTVGSFAGFLQVSAFDMRANFGGTDAELEEIYSLLRNGVYVS